MANLPRWETERAGLKFSPAENCRIGIHRGDAIDVRVADVKATPVLFSGAPSHQEGLSHVRCSDESGRVHGKLHPKAVKCP